MKPACAPCRTRGYECEYAHERTVSALQRKVAELEKKLDRCQMEILGLRRRLAAQDLGGCDEPANGTTPSFRPIDSAYIDSSSPDYGFVPTETPETSTAWPKDLESTGSPAFQHRLPIHVFGKPDMEPSMAVASYAEDPRNMQVMHSSTYRST